MRSLCALIFLWISAQPLFAQNQAELHIEVFDSLSIPQPDILFFVEETQAVLLTDSLGRMFISLPAGAYTFSSSSERIVPFLQKVILLPSEKKFIRFTVLPIETTLPGITIEGQKSDLPMVQRLDAEVALVQPGPFGDFNKMVSLSALGASSNSELTSQYQVRGGSYDENLIYVNGFEIYRPQIAGQGAQEGLSYVHPFLVDAVNFSSGGWAAQYGDRLASIMDVRYRQPTKVRVGVQASLLYAGIFAEAKHNRFRWQTGWRYKNARYLLGTLDIDGNYQPVFYDGQTYLNYTFGKKRNYAVDGAHNLSGFFSWGQNKYNLIPSTRETAFGSFDQPQQFEVQYEGEELLQYQTLQTGIGYEWVSSEKQKVSFRNGFVRSQELEQYDVLASYRLCDLNPNTGISQNDCIRITQSGTQFSHARNTLDVYRFQSKLDFIRSGFRAGLNFTQEHFQDVLDEYQFIDSAARVEFIYGAYGTNTVNASTYEGYVQQEWSGAKGHYWNAGVRVNYRSLNQDGFISPRVQYRFKAPSWKHLSLSSAAGLYGQQPAFREMRRLDGSLNTRVKAQKSIHIIQGLRYHWRKGNKPFIWQAEIWYKYLDDLVPYQVQDIRIRYFPDASATGYAYGLDLRLSGEFVKSEESWINLGFLVTRENVEGDGQGYLARPTDQRMVFSLFFQDHIPGAPSFKVHLTGQFASGLPFGLPNSIENRTALRIPAYRRVDIGFSKMLVKGEHRKAGSLQSAWISLEILNLLGINNTISYTWIADVNRNQYPIPNTLSQRYLNLRLMMQW
jgi:hypothetical protein